MGSALEVCSTTKASGKVITIHWIESSEWMKRRMANHSLSFVLSSDSVRSSSNRWIQTLAKFIMNSSYEYSLWIHPMNFHSELLTMESQYESLPMKSPYEFSYMNKIRGYANSVRCLSTSSWKQLMLHWSPFDGKCFRCSKVRLSRFPGRHSIWQAKNINLKDQTEFRSSFLTIFMNFRIWKILSSNLIILI